MLRGDLISVNASEKRDLHSTFPGTETMDRHPSANVLCYFHNSEVTDNHPQIRTDRSIFQPLVIKEEPNDKSDDLRDLLSTLLELIFRTRF